MTHWSWSRWLVLVAAVLYLGNVVYRRIAWPVNAGLAELGVAHQSLADAYEGLLRATEREAFEKGKLVTTACFYAVSRCGVSERDVFACRMRDMDDFREVCQQMKKLPTSWVDDSIACRGP